MIKKLLTAILIAILYLLWPNPAAASDWVWPTHGCPITSYQSYGHPRGIDLGCQYGDPVYAAKGGYVTYAGWDYPDTGYGYRIDLYDYVDLTRYGHLQTILVDSGQWIEQGTQIGTVGDTGNAYGPHLHFEIWWEGMVVDPLIPLP